MAVLEFSLTVGDRIALALRKANMTQIELADRLPPGSNGKRPSQSTVSRWIGGGPIAVKRLVEIAEVTGQRRLLLDLTDIDLADILDPANLPDADDSPDLGEPSSGCMNETAGHGWCEPKAA